MAEHPRFYFLIKTYDADVTEVIFAWKYLKVDINNHHCSASLFSGSKWPGALSLRVYVMFNRDQMILAIC